jgi:membrane-bound lytic murein transglycosylase A
MGRRSEKALLGMILTLAMVASCAAPRTETAEPEAYGEGTIGDLSRVSWLRAPALSDDLPPSGLLDAVAASIGYYEKQSPDKLYRFGRDVYKAGDLKKALEDFAAIVRRNPGEEERRKALKEGFVVYRGGGGEKEVLVTGYYEPILNGSRLPGIGNNVPIYGLPKDLITVDSSAFVPDMGGKRLVGRYQNGSLVPYYTRYEIDNLGVLRGRGYELAWIADPLDAFFLQVQGSGRIMLPSGGQLSVGYAGNNGRAYRSIGKLLIETGKIPDSEMSMHTLKQYLRTHPEDREAVLAYNENYVFFKEVPSGPLGSTGVLLTPERSVATDPGNYPPGALAYLETEAPMVGEDGRQMGWKKVARFVLNQDAGGAIRGPGRVDLFWGSGEESGRVAGWMKKPGRLYFLAPKPGK